MKIKIGNSYIGLNQPCYIVAELSANHQGSLDFMLRMIREAKKIGANAIKIQTYTADTITLNSNKKDFKIPNNSPWKKFKNLWNLYDNAKTPLEWHKRIFNEAKKNKIDIFASVFDETLVDFLEELNCPAYKIASAEINHIPLIKKVAKTKKPIILSTGLANKNDLEIAIKTIKKCNNEKIIVLKCVSSYPAPLEESNLKTILDIEKKYGVLAGVSDHTEGSIVPITSCSIGAKVIEKHLDIENNKKSIDSFFSMKSDSFKEMIKSVRMTEKALGKIDYSISKSSKASQNNKNSIYVCKNIKKGEYFSKENIKIIRPGYGLHPIYWESVLGKKSRKNLSYGDPLRLNNIQNLKKLKI